MNKIAIKNMASWELKNMIKALSSLNGFLNSKEDNIRLKEAKKELKRRKD